MLMDLNAYLAKRTPEQTDTLLQLWGISLPSTNKINMAALLAEMQREESARLVWERLNAEERLVLGRVLQVAKGWLPRSNLYQTVSLPPETIDHALPHLGDLGLAICEMAKLCGNELAAPIQENPQNSWWRPSEPPKPPKPVEEKEIVYPLVNLRAALRNVWQEAPIPNTITPRYP